MKLHVLTPTPVYCCLATLISCRMRNLYHTPYTNSLALLLVVIQFWTKYIPTYHHGSKPPQLYLWFLGLTMIQFIYNHQPAADPPRSPKSVKVIYRRLVSPNCKALLYNQMLRLNWTPLFHMNSCHKMVD